MDWDKRIVSKELLLYMREQLIAALATKDEYKLRFNPIGMTAKFLSEAIWEQQDDSAIADIIEEMNNAVYYAHLQRWSEADEFASYCTVEKIEAIYSNEDDTNNSQES